MSSPSDGDEFYESLDRILSRSCSSASASASASDDDATTPHRRHRFPPPAAVSYDVWISEPAPVEERRRLLLQQLGLSGDRTLSRLKSTRKPDLPLPDLRRAAAEVGRSASCDALPRRPLIPSPAVARSRSDGSVDSPPTDEHSCTIRNLDNGREFVVRDALSDRMHNEVSEVGTGRQLTMEEFEICVGHSPIVQELMRRQISSGAIDLGDMPKADGTAARWRKRRTSWLRSIKSIAGNVVAGGHAWEKRSIDERDLLSEKGWRRSSSVSDECLNRIQPASTGPVRIGVRHSGKHYKELSSLFMTGEIHGHSGAIWCIKFSFDGQYLASAGEDQTIQVWQVTECDSKGDLLLKGAVRGDVNCHPFLALISNEASDSALVTSCLEMSHCDRKRRAKAMSSRRFMSMDHVMVPENIFALSEKPIRSFRGHGDDVLDLSWSKSQYLLSSSMDKTVKLWHLSSISCLKTFSHSDYVTCIQFNPVDDRYFISGSLDEKVRIWSIPDRKVVDWNDLHEMVTAVCYTPNGQSALVGSHKGSCHRFDTSDNKLHHRGQIDLRNKKKKSSSRKITGFQFAPGSSSEVLITSADSRIRVVDGLELVHKFKGFRNTSSQISASLSTNAKYVISASEDSHVYVWRHDADSWPSAGRGVVTVSKSYEHFYCQDVTAAVPWPVTSIGGNLSTPSCKKNGLNGVSEVGSEVLSEDRDRENSPISASSIITDPQDSSVHVTVGNSFGDEFSTTWPKGNFLMRNDQSNRPNSGDSPLQVQSKSAWRMVIVAAGRGGEIRIFQNFGFPVRI